MARAGTKKLFNMLLQGQEHVVYRLQNCTYFGTAAKTFDHI
jgi:hypothetical protein